MNGATARFSMMARGALCAEALTLVAAPAVARDTITIGITQFPATFHPSINSMLAKSYVLHMALRPLTAFDQDWKLICLLCTTLPTMENGLAEPEGLTA